MSEAKIKLSVNGAREAKSDLESVGGAFTSMGDKAKASIVGIAAGVGVGTFAAMVKGAIDAADNLNDLSKATSISVEQLAGLDLAARQSGGDLEGIAKSVNKLSENIGKNAEKFAAIGITSKEPLEAFKQFADVFKSIEDPQQKAAFGAVALGKAWESAAPLLAEGGKNIGEMVEKGSKLSGMTKSFADDSDKFNDKLAEMSTVAGGVAARMGADLLPLMNAVLVSLVDTSEEAAKAGPSFNPITEAFRALIVVGGNVAFVIKGIGAEIGGISAQIAALASGDWRGALSIGDMMKEDAAQARESFDKWEANIMNVGKVAKETAKEIATIPLALPGQTVNVSGFIGTDEDAKAAERAAEKARQEGERASKAKLSFVAALEKELQTIGKSVEQNKLYEASLLGIKGRQLDLVKSKLASIEAQKKLYEEEERWFALGDKLLDQHNDSIQSMVDNVDDLQEQVKAQQEYNDNLGLSKEALAELAAVKLEDAAAGKERNAQMLEEIGLETQQIGILREQADELRKLANLKRQGTAKEAAIDRSNELAAQTKKDFDAMQSEAQKFTDSLYQGLSDSLMRGFEAGKGFFKTFWDSIRNLFKTTVLKLAVQGVMTGVLGLGGVGAATAQGLGGGGLGSTVSAISTGKTLWEGFATAGTAAGVFGSTGFMASLAGGLNGAGIGSGLTSAAGLSIGGGIQSVIGTSAAGTLSGGVSAISGVLAAIPVWGWAALGAAAVASAFGGGKDRVTGAQSVSGTLGTNDLMRNVDWTKDGGWFNADTKGTWNYNLSNSTAKASNGQYYQDTANVANDQKLLTQLNTTYDAIKAASGDYATALGLNADLITGRVDKMSFALGKTQEEIDKAIQGMFGTIADDMAKTLIPSIASMTKEGETASEALGRIATGFGTANAIFTDLQLSLFKVSDEGYKASSVFVDLVGGVDALKSASTSYYENFYTQEERNANVIKSLTAEFEKQALPLQTTREGYRALVEEISKTGTPEQLATLFKLNDAFASVIKTTEDAAEELNKLASAQLRSARLGDVADRRASELAQSTIKQASDDAFKTLVESVQNGVQSLLRAGDINAALEAQMSITKFDKSNYTNADGGFNAGAFNLNYASQQAKAAKEMMTKASADAINVIDIGSVMSGLLSTIFNQDIENSLKANLAQTIKLPENGLISMAVSDLLNASVQSFQLENNVSRGQGIASVIAAQMDLDFASFRGFKGFGVDVEAYGNAIEGLNYLVKNGKIEQNEYALALESVNKLAGDAVQLLGNEAAQRERILTAQKALNESGIDSIAFYFGQIGKAVEDLTAKAIEANTPLAQATAGIGRLTSLSDVLSQSAKAALTGGANLGDGNVINAQVVAQAAAIAAQTLTTQDAFNAQKLLAEKSSFASASENQLRDASFILDGLKAFDSSAFEQSFLKLNNSLNKGTITQEQYQDIFAQSLNTFKGLDGVDKVTDSLKSSMEKLRDSMGSFADQLLIDKNKTTLSASATFEELTRQYEVAKTSAMTGDADAISKYIGLANQLTETDRYSSRAEANAAFGKVYGDARSLEALGINTLRQNNGENVVSELKTLNKNLTDKVDNLEKSLVFALAEIAKNTKNTSNNIEALGIA